MKKNFITYLLALFTLGLFAQKTIENPAYEVNKTGYFNITKIEITDTETKVYLHNTFLPKDWVAYNKKTYLEDSDTGEKYNIIKVEGFEFGEKIWMSETGEINTVAIFPPLKKDVKKINFQKFIFGISLTKKQQENKVPKKVKKWFKKELAKVKIKPLENFDAPNFFNNTPAKLIGYIKGYDSRLGFKTGITYLRNSITSEDYPIVIEIYEDGRFEANLPITHPTFNNFSLNRERFNYYVEPGQTLAMVLNWEEFLLADRFSNERHKFKNIEFLGPLAKVNYDLLNYTKNDFDYDLFKKQQKEITPKDFKKLQVKNHQKNTIHLLKHLATHDVSDKATTILKNKNTLENANLMFDFVSHRDYYAKQDTLNKVLKIPVENNYYNFLQDIDLNNQNLLVGNDFSTFINRFGFCEPFNFYSKINKLNSSKTFLQYIKNNKIEISSEYKKLLENSEKLDTKTRNEFHEKNEKKLKKYKSKYSKEHNAYNDHNLFYYVQKRIELKDSVLTNVLKLDKSLAYQITKTSNIDYIIRQMKKRKYAYEYWNLLKNNIKNTFLLAEVERILYKKFPLISSETDNLIPKTTKLPQGKATDIFNKIIAPHKGKILFIDFWATSCSPCVGGIKRMKETREKYKNNKDFDFVFVTSERGSPKKKYNEFVKEQELENIYRLPADEYNYLRQLFEFNGIPRYIVVDKKGDLIDGDFQMHNFKHNLNEILANHK